MDINLLDSYAEFFMIACSAGSIFAIIDFFLVIDLSRPLTLNVTYKKTPIFLDPEATFNFEVEIQDFNDKDLHIMIFSQYKHVIIKWVNPVASNMIGLTIRDSNANWDIQNVQNDKNAKRFAIKITPLDHSDAGNLTVVANQVKSNQEGMDTKSEKIELQIAGAIIIVFVLLTANYSKCLSHKPVFIAFIVCASHSIFTR